MTDTAEPQHFDGGECPECFLVLVGEIATNTADSIVGPIRRGRFPDGSRIVAVLRSVPAITSPGSVFCAATSSAAAAARRSAADRTN